MITVLGATGRTGGRVARLLLAAGEPVRAVGRSVERLAPLVEAGAEACAGDAGVPEFLAGALRGADAAYVMFPVDPAAEDYFGEQRRLGAAVATAAAGVEYVVLLSSLGADLPSGTGFVAALHEHEQRLAALPNVLVLRPGSFYENFVEALGVVRAIGMVVDAVEPDVLVPMVSVRDVAAVAAGALRARDWTGTVVRELRGPRDLSHTEATAILGARIGQPDLAYVRPPDAELIGALRATGFSATSARLHVELGRAISDGTIVAHRPRTRVTTGPTPFEDVADELARGYLEVAQ